MEILQDGPFYPLPKYLIASVIASSFSGIAVCFCFQVAARVARQYSDKDYDNTTFLAT